MISWSTIDKFAPKLNGAGGPDMVLAQVGPVDCREEISMGCDKAKTTSLSWDRGGPAFLLFSRSNKYFSIPSSKIGFFL